MIEWRGSGILFDLDGTLIDSLPAVERAWTLWAHRVQLEPSLVLRQIHGRRSLDSVRALAPDRDPLVEDAWLRAQESTDTEGVRMLPGAADLIATLYDAKWAVVTSGTRDVATARLQATGIPIRPSNVYGDDVERGKPDPQPFALGAKRLGLTPSSCLVLEDTASGIRSASDAGCFTVGIAHEAHDVSKLMGSGARCVIRSLRDLRVVQSGEALHVSIQEAVDP